MTATYTKTFPDGFTVQMKDGMLGTNDADQLKWFDEAKIKKTILVLAEHAPEGTSADSLIALAMQQVRAAWMGIEEIRSEAKK